MAKLNKKAMEIIDDYFHWRRQHLLCDLSIIKMHDSKLRYVASRSLRARISEIDKIQKALKDVLNQINYEKSKTIHLVKKRRFLLDEKRRRLRRNG